MEPRLIFRTHYQVDEPAYMEFLIKLCTSPIQSTYPEVVAQRLAQEIRARCKQFNEAAGRYAVGLAISLGVINPNNVWTDKGLLVNLIAEVNGGDAETQLSLTLPEKLLHFRLFLEADGGILLYLARYIIQHSSFPAGDKMNEFASEMFTEILSDYLSITTNTADRLHLRREIERITSEGYQGNSGAHKLSVHLQTLFRLGLIARSDARSRSYSLEHPQTEDSDLKRLADVIPNLMALEEAVTSHKLIEIGAQVLRVPYSPWNEEERDAIFRLIAQFYTGIVASGVPLCPLSSLIEAVQITLLARGALFDYSQAENLLSELQHRHPKDVRFHVDRRGQLAFVKMSDEMIKALH